MKTVFIALASLLVVLACSLEFSGPVSEYFAKKDLTIMGACYNKEKHTREVLYGNSAALAPSLSGRKTAVYTLFTYREQTDPASYDFSVRSTLLKTETLSYTASQNGLKPVYTVTNEQSSKNVPAANSAVRKAYLLHLSQAASR